MSYWKHCVAQLAVVLLFAAILSHGARADLLVRGLGTVSPAPMGDVGDVLMGGGAGISGDVHFAASPVIFLGGGFLASVLGGEDLTAAVDYTTGSFLFGFHASALVLAALQDAVTAYGGLGIGRGGLAWAYGEEVENLIGEESDGIGFFYFLPQAGLAYRVSPAVSLHGGAQVLLPVFDDETIEGLRWDLDGGSLIQIVAGVGLHL